MYLLHEKFPTHIKIFSLSRSVSNRILWRMKYWLSASQSTQPFYYVINKALKKGFYTQTVKGAGGSTRQWSTVAAINAKKKKTREEIHRSGPTQIYEKFPRSRSTGANTKSIIDPAFILARGRRPNFWRMNATFHWNMCPCLDHSFARFLYLFWSTPNWT